MQLLVAESIGTKSWQSNHQRIDSIRLKVIRFAHQSSALINLALRPSMLCSCAWRFRGVVTSSRVSSCRRVACTAWAQKRGVVNAVIITYEVYDLWYDNAGYCLCARLIISELVFVFKYVTHGALLSRGQ
jgi:hypothetical protein